MQEGLNEASAREILGVSNTASFKEIKKAHKTLVGIFHPDRAPQDHESQSRANAATSRINIAWKLIEQLEREGRLGDFSESTSRSSTNASWNFVSRRPAEGECGLCGSTPAKHFHFRGVISWLLAIGWPSYSGYLCKSCALAMSNNILSTTMLRGWWGIGAPLTPFFIGYQLWQERKIDKLESPKFRDIRVISPYDFPVRPIRHPLKSLRPVAASILALLLMVSGVFLANHQNLSSQQSNAAESIPTIITNPLATPSEACWTAADSNGLVTRISCSDPTAALKLLAIATTQADCPVGTIGTLANKTSGDFSCIGQNG